MIDCRGRVWGRTVVCPLFCCRGMAEPGPVDPRFRGDDGVGGGDGWWGNDDGWCRNQLGGAGTLGGVKDGGDEIVGGVNGKGAHEFAPLRFFSGVTPSP